MVSVNTRFEGTSGGSTQIVSISGSSVTLWKYGTNAVMFHVTHSALMIPSQDTSVV